MVIPRSSKWILELIKILILKKKREMYGIQTGY